MKAFIEKGVSNIEGKKHCKENHFYQQYSLICFDPSKTEGCHSVYENGFSEVVILRLYATQARNATQARTYACVWLHTSSCHQAGSGMASGYGYHRGSQAAERAFKQAGITFDTPIGGVGEYAIRNALKAIAIELGLPHYYIIEAYG